MSTQPGDLLTHDWQIEIDRGLLLAEPLYRADLRTRARPDLRTAREGKPNDHGMLILGPDRAGSRLLDLTVRIRAVEEPAAVAAALDDLEAAWAPRPAGVGTLAWRRPGERRFVYGRPGRRDIDDSKVRFGLAKANLQWEATDPRVYSLTRKTATINSDGVDAGRSYPLTYPRTYAGGSPGSTTAINAGRTDTWPLLRVDGPATDPIIHNDTTGLSVALDGYTVPAGQYIEFDPKNRIVYANGLTDADLYPFYLLPQSTWWPLQVGENSIRFVASDTGVTSKLTVAWRDAWL